MGLDAAVSRLWIAALAVFCISAAGAAQAPSGTHIGVASCAGSNCHGSNAPQPPAQGVLHNEYLTWQRDDPHAGAYRSLLTPRALEIGRRLGIADPSKSDTCVDCHADDVPASDRGARFALSDGVGCEACHGGASTWIVEHAQAHRSHAANLKAGMYPTDDPQARAELCLGCHYGAADKLMTHSIMAAGHPPLLFELTTYTAIQPAHYRVDADYRQRKHYVGPADTWAMGQAAAAARVLDTLVARGLPQAPGVVPDFYLYACYGCHQPLQPESDALVEGRPEAGGELPLAVDSLRMLGTILDAGDPDLAQRWSQAMAALHLAAPADLAGDVGQLRSLTTEAAADLSKRPLSPRVCHAIALSLAQEGAHAAYSGRGFADQTVMAMTVLYHADQEVGAASGTFGSRFPTALDSAYKALHSVSEFDEAAYRSAMQQIEKSLNNK
ncbi:MAG TPA: multiheme c-type cytochrome [Gammaproteobacteria bacterium]|nr:multiheme c-type cytochrome [Gammaproteobacteria bacterium]